jgi:F0F1-type ATP synthase assembly protein I
MIITMSGWLTKGAWSLPTNTFRKGIQMELIATIVLMVVAIRMIWKIHANEHRIKILEQDVESLEEGKRR